MNSFNFCAAFLAVLQIGAIEAYSQLAVSVSPPRVIGSKAVLNLELKNTFPTKIESARATLFLLDDQGKMAGQSTRWVIGGSKDLPSLASGATNTFNFVIPTDNLKTTNFTAKVQFTRIILEGGQLANPVKDVHIVPAKSP